MPEVGEVPPEVVAQNMDDAAKKENGMTFDDVKEKAWLVSQEPLNQWQERIKDKVKEKASGINQHLNDLSILYGEPVPNSVVVSLQRYPREGTQKGEPINNFVESGRLDEETADVLYWVSNPSILPTDSPEDIEKIYENSTDRALGSILHETQHRSFQKKGFEQLIQTSEQNPEVKQVLDKLEGVSGDYLEVTNELVTTYLETFGKKKLGESQEAETTTTPLVVEVDKEKTGAVLEAVIKEDVEGRRDKGKGPGPYTDLRQRWENELGGLPEGYQTKEGERDVTEKDSDRSYMGVQIYEIARQLDTGLAERYVEEGRQMDEEFVVELYKMVDSELEKQKVGNEILAAAEKIILTPTPPITDKEIVAKSGDKRDFVSLSPYWHKTEDGKLVLRDGEINPEARKYTDSERLSEATGNILITTLAAESSEDEADRTKYAQYAVSALNAWFVDEDTRMTPSLEYAQVKQGETTGNHYGIIEGVELIRVIESVDLLKESGLIDEDTQKGVEVWFGQYLKWLNESEKGKSQRDMPNNHGTFYDFQVAHIADFLGNEELARETIKSTQERIASQIEPNGEMLRETERTLPYDYQLFNLYGLSEMAVLGEKYDVDLWNYETQDGRGLKKAFEYFTSQLDATKENPFKMNRSGELHLTYRSASKAYGKEEYWDLPKRFYNDPLVDEVTTQMFKQD